LLRFPLSQKTSAQVNTDASYPINILTGNAIYTIRIDYQNME
jgi:hypothetical protein